MGCSVCVPSPHTMVVTHNQGKWTPHLSDHSINLWKHCNNALCQGLTMSVALLGDGNLTKPILCKTSGHQILWQLACVAKHPCLFESHIDIAMPKQKSDELLPQCHLNWTHCLHVMCLHGVFLSDCHFVESFLCNVLGACDGTVKPLLIHLVWHIKFDVACPNASNWPIFFPTWPLLLLMLVSLA